MFLFLREAYVAWRMKKANRSSSTGDMCVACDSSNVTMLAPKTYLCDDCGHEGGDAKMKLRKNLSIPEGSLEIEQDFLSQAVDMHMDWGGVSRIDFITHGRTEDTIENAEQTLDAIESELGTNFGVKNLT